MHIMGFHHLAIQVADVDGCAAFYREVLGLQELARHHRPDGSLRSVWLSVGGGEKGFLAVEHCESEPTRMGAGEGEGALGLSMFALRIARAQREAIVEALSRRGIAVRKQTRWTIYFEDPEGNSVALSHHPED
jgi:glyoxylase I family protein